MNPCFGSHIHQKISVFDDFFFVFHHYHRVAQITQFFQYFDQPPCIARMQPDRRLIENIHGGCQIAAQRTGQMNALRFAAAEGVGNTVEREVTEPQIDHELQTVINFKQEPPGDLPVVLTEFELLEKGQYFIERHTG